MENVFRYTHGNNYLHLIIIVKLLGVGLLPSVNLFQASSTAKDGGPLKGEDWLKMFPRNLMLLKARFLKPRSIAIVVVKLAKRVKFHSSGRFDPHFWAFSREHICGTDLKITEVKSMIPEAESKSKWSVHGNFLLLLIHSDDGCPRSGSDICPTKGVSTRSDSSSPSSSRLLR